jgi:hypothetical protein
MQNYKDRQQTQQTDKWLREQGINPAHIYIGPDELFQAQRLATNTLKLHQSVLGQNQAHTLQNFLKAAAMPKTRKKITLAYCQKIMNIAKSAQREYTKFVRKQRRQQG